MSEGDEINLGRLFLMLWTGKWVILLCMMLAALLALLVIGNTRPTYQADALMQLEERGGSLALPPAMRDLVQTSTTADAEAAIITSRLVLGQVVADLNLDMRAVPVQAPVLGVLLSRYALPLPDLTSLAPYQRPGEQFEVELLRVPAEWFGQNLLLRVTASGYDLTLPDGQLHAGVPGETLLLPEAGVALHVARIDAPVGREYQLSQVEPRDAIEALRRELFVSERGRQSGILQARLTGYDRRQIERVLAAITESYVHQNVSRSSAEAERGLEFIRTQLPQAEQRLTTAQNALNQYREEVAEGARFQDETNTEDRSFESQALLNQISRIEAELRRVIQRLEDGRSRLSEDHPVIRQTLREQSELERRLAELLGQAQNLPETQREIINLTRELELAQQIFFDLQTRMQEMQVLQASTVGSVRIIDAANAARQSIAPRTSLLLGMGLVLGGLAGVILVLLRNWLRRGVQDPEDLEQVNLPVFATISYSPEADTMGKRGGDLPIMALKWPDNLAVEAFRSLRTSLHFGMLDAPNKAIAITSTAPEAGKSFTSVNLAVVAAHAGQRVVLIDADMRRGQLRRYFGIPRQQAGLAQLLSGKCTLEEAIISSGIEGLSLIPAGPYPPNPSELLMRSGLEALLQGLDQEYDLIIIDCPPVLAVTDPVIVARHAGTTVLVVRHDRTAMAEVNASLRAFESAGARFAGAILNGFDPRRARARSGSYGYTYGYRYTYKPREN